MQPDIEKYKLVRRGKKYCVRIRGFIDTVEMFDWCYDRNIKCQLKVRHDVGYTWQDLFNYAQRWDYDLTFNKSTDATAFILGYL